MEALKGGEVKMELDSLEIESVFFCFISIVLMESLVDRENFLKERSRVKKRKRSQLMPITGRVLKSPTILPSLKRPIQIDS